MKTDIRQEQIIDEAIKIIHKNGYSELSIRELAKQVQISEGAIYKHFSGKEEIISGITKRIFAYTNSLFEELELAVSTEDKLRRFIFFHLELFENKPELVSVMFSDELFELKSSLSENVLEIIKKRQILLRNLLTTGIEEGKFKDLDSEIISTMIQGYIKLTISKWKQSGYKFSLIEQGEKFYKTLTEILINN
ncbi:MAG: TetR/AcrR family transcriptional regulator [bacterium]